MIFTKLVLIADKVGGKPADVRVRMGKEITSGHKTLVLAMLGSLVQHLLEGRRIKRKVITFQIETDIIGDPHDDMLVGLLIYVVIEDTFAISYDIAQKSQLISLKRRTFRLDLYVGSRRNLVWRSRGRTRFLFRNIVLGQWRRNIFRRKGIRLFRCIRLVAGEIRILRNRIDGRLNGRCIPYGFSRLVLFLVETDLIDLVE